MRVTFFIRNGVRKSRFNKLTMRALCSAVDALIGYTISKPKDLTVKIDVVPDDQESAAKPDTGYMGQILMVATHDFIPRICHLEASRCRFLLILSCKPTCTAMRL